MAQGKKQKEVLEALEVLLRICEAAHSVYRDKSTGFVQALISHAVARRAWPLASALLMECRTRAANGDAAARKTVEMWQGQF